MSDVATYWNGEPTPARRVRVKVGQAPRPTWWCADLAGSEQPAVQVCYGGRTFYLDDIDGSGWRKVTEGRGGPTYAHRSFPDSSLVVSNGSSRHSQEGDE